jgi:hypothetical protein
MENVPDRSPAPITRVDGMLTLPPFESATVSELHGAWSSVTVPTVELALRIESAASVSVDTRRKERTVSSVWIDAPPAVALIVTGVSLRTVPTRALNDTWVRPDRKETVGGSESAASLLWSCTTSVESRGTGAEIWRTNETLLPATGLFVSTVNVVALGSNCAGSSAGDAMTTSGMACTTMRRTIRFLI